MEKNCFYKVIHRGSETSVQVDFQGALCSSKGGEVNIAINMEYRKVSYPINILEKRTLMIRMRMDDTSDDNKSDIYKTKDKKNHRTRAICG